MTWLLMWFNQSVVTINTMLQLLYIYIYINKYIQIFIMQQDNILYTKLNCINSKNTIVHQPKADMREKKNQKQKKKKIYIYIYYNGERERERQPFVCEKIENYAWNERGNDKFII